MTDGPISPRLKNALVADLVMADPSRDSDRLLLDPMRDEDDWVEHFARQLHIDAPWGSGIPDTLVFVLREVDELLRTWPPRHDAETCRAIAHEATKHLRPLEVFGTLLAGPPTWQRETITGGRIDKLAAQMQPVLQKGLAAELGRVLEEWERWDVRDLRARRNEARRAKERADEEARRQEFAAAGRERRRATDRSDDRKPLFIPPPPGYRPPKPTPRPPPEPT
ncbi:MAG TPA: hypothetical protein VM345_01055 [Acidimicrobiales bacterium]|nr:hypothetical protein [Acidimicrobiales bacterium]